MRRGTLILMLGVLGAAIAYCCLYLLGTTAPRTLMRSAQPELAWLKHEFNLSDAEFKRVSELHARYLPQCRERCRLIDEFNTRLSNTLATATRVTPELEKLLNERAQMRATCQAEMLKHFFEVSLTMPSQQRKRYLAWVRENTCLREKAMNHGLADHVEKATPAHEL